MFSYFLGKFKMYERGLGSQEEKNTERSFFFLSFHFEIFDEIQQIETTTQLMPVAALNDFIRYNCHFIYKFSLL